MGLNPDGTAKEQWYNPYLECQPKFGSANGDTAPLVGTKTKYMATPGWPTRTMGVFNCKWEIKRDPSVKFGLSIHRSFFFMNFDDFFGAEKHIPYTAHQTYFHDNGFRL